MFTHRRHLPSENSPLLHAKKTRLRAVTITPHGYLNNGCSWILWITLRHTLMIQNIALRWTDATKSASHYSSGRRPSAYHPSPSASQMQNSKISAALRAKNHLRVIKTPAYHIRHILRVKSHSLHAIRLRRTRHTSPQSSPTPKGLNAW